MRSRKPQPCERKIQELNDEIFDLQSRISELEGIVKQLRGQLKITLDLYSDAVEAHARDYSSYATLLAQVHKPSAN